MLRVARAAPALGFSASLSPLCRLSHTVSSSFLQANSSKKRGDEEKDDADMVKRIVFTGGPCGGKSTALVIVADSLRARGYPVYLVPETATLLMTGGVSFKDLSSNDLITVQTELMKVQMATEDAFWRVAHQKGEPAVIISDRGTMDSCGYLGRANFEKLLKNEAWCLENLREARYDGVCHLVTAADGAEEFYSFENNATRTESPEEARHVDLLLQQAWLGHPHVEIVGNQTGFAEKIAEVEAFVASIVGFDIPSRTTTRRFKIKRINTDVMERETSTSYEFLLEKIWLTSQVSADTQARLEKRRSVLPGAVPVYRYSEKNLRTGLMKMRRISAREFEALKPLASSRHTKTVQMVKNFIYKSQYFSLVNYVMPRREKFEYVELRSEKANIEFPDFLEVDREVTGDDQSQSFARSRIDHD